MCKLNMRSLSSAQSTVLESQGAHSEAESELEAYRVEAEATQQELSYQLQTAKQAIDELIHSRKKHQKQIMRLENECRRLDSENLRLREELNMSRKSVRRATAPPQRVCMASTATQVEEDIEIRAVDMTAVTQELKGLRMECREQGGQVSSCLKALRQTREVQKHVYDLISHVQTALTPPKPTPTGDPILETCERAEDPGDAKYSRLLDELQDLTDSESLNESVFKAQPHFSDAYLIESPVQAKVDSLEADIQSLQASLKNSNSQLRRIAHHGKSASAQIMRTVGRGHQRKGSLARAYQMSLATHWSLLV